MIEESAQVTKVTGDTVWVMAIQKSACGSCEAQKGCGHSLLAKVGQKQIELPVDRNGLDVSVDDMVVIGVPEQAILKTSLLMYGLPLGFMIFVALMAKWLSLSEGLSVVLAFVSLLCGFVVVNLQTRNLNFEKYQPQLMRKVAVEQSLLPMCET
jgi:sigma-E factor negative regulatory protein RseC